MSDPGDARQQAAGERREAAGTRNIARLRSRLEIKRGRAYATLYGEELNWLCDAADFTAELERAVYEGRVELPDDLARLLWETRPA